MEKKILSDHKSQTVVKMKVRGNLFEILVNLQKALDYRKTGKGNLIDIVLFDNVFRDYKKGIRAGTSELEAAFGTSDIYEIAKKMINEGEIQLPTEHKAKAREEKEKQIVEWLAKSCVNPQNGLPHPPQRIKGAMEEVGVRIDENKPAEEQALQIMKIINKILPIKIEVKKIALKVPTANAAKAYGVIKEFLVKEEWLSDGTLSCVVEVPQASLMTFYDKLNSITHGTAIAKEL